MNNRVLLVLLFLTGIGSIALAGVVEEGFEKGSIDPVWKVEGKAEVAVSTGGKEVSVHNGTKSMILGENSNISFDFSKTDTFGKVTFWVCDNKFKADWKKAGFVSGPFWGIKNTKGQVLLAGVAFRDHTTGDKLYNWMATTEIGGEDYIWWMDLKRTEGWHKWEINYPDDKESVKLIKDEKESPQDWTFSRYKTGWTGGFNGIVIRGNKQLTEDVKDPFYFDDIKIEFK